MKTIIMKPFAILLGIWVVTSIGCDRKPFVEHKLNFEKVADGCSNMSSNFKMNSNFGGERFEFEKCLPADFTKDQMTAERRGDSVVVNFKQPHPGKPTAVFAITLDIDSYPEYTYITIDRDTYLIGHSK